MKDTLVYAPYYQAYIDKVTQDPLLVLKDQYGSMSKWSELALNLDYRYAEGKWSIRELLIHLIDVEVIFLSRFYRISKGDTTPLPGFDHDGYVNNQSLGHMDQSNIFGLMKATRLHTIHVLKTTSGNSFSNVGEASGHKVSASALAYMMAGHFIHHMEILRDRYGVDI